MVYPPKKFILAVAICFCVLYLCFIHKESSYKFYDNSRNIFVKDIKEQPVDQIDVTDKRYPASTDSMVYPAQSSSSSMTEETHKPHKYAVILNCEGRSGSTWLSAFFWWNPHVFYTYEPLFPNQQNTQAMASANLPKNEGKVHQLADGFQCNLDYSKKETIFPHVVGRYPMYQPELKHCAETNTCPINLTRFCKARSHVVQKVIRVFDISDYQYLKENIDSQLKIIHLVRDPRPHIISREKLFSYMFDEWGTPYKNLPPEEKSRQRRQLCLRELKNMKIGDSGLYDTDSYIRLSHEEMSLEPIKWAQKLYQFVGLDFTEETEQYIREITHGHDKVHNGKDPDGRFAGFSVYRDTLQILYKWKTASPEHLHEIETECKELLEYLGYVNVYDDDLNVINENPWPSLNGTEHDSM